MDREAVEEKLEEDDGFEAAIEEGRGGYLGSGDRRLLFKKSDDGTVISPTFNDLHLTVFEKGGKVVYHLKRDGAEEALDKEDEFRQDLDTKIYSSFRGLGELEPYDDWSERSLQEDPVAKGFVRVDVSDELGKGDGHVDESELREMVRPLAEEGLKPVDTEEALASDMILFRDTETGERVMPMPDGYALVWGDDESFEQKMRDEIPFYDMMHRLMETGR